jgi:hypothetical protein
MESIDCLIHHRGTTGRFEERNLFDHRLWLKEDHLGAAANIIGINN